MDTKTHKKYFVVTDILKCLCNDDKRNPRIIFNLKTKTSIDKDGRPSLHLTGRPEDLSRRLHRYLTDVYGFSPNIIKDGIFPLPINSYVIIGGDVYFYLNDSNITMKFIDDTGSVILCDGVYEMKFLNIIQRAKMYTLGDAIEKLWKKRDIAFNLIFENGSVIVCTNNFVVFDHNSEITAHSYWEILNNKNLVLWRSSKYEITGCGPAPWSPDDEWQISEIEINGIITQQVIINAGLF